MANIFSGKILLHVLLQVKVASPTSLSVFKAFLVVLYFALSIYFILSVYSLYMILKIQKKSVTTFLDQEFEQGSKCQGHPWSIIFLVNVPLFEARLFSILFSSDNIVFCAVILYLLQVLFTIHWKMRNPICHLTGIGNGKPKKLKILIKKRDHVKFLPPLSPDFAKTFWPHTLIWIGKTYKTWFSTVSTHCTMG